MGLSIGIRGALSTFSMCLIFRSDSGSPVPYFAQVDLILFARKGHRRMMLPLPEQNRDQEETLCRYRNQ